MKLKRFNENKDEFYSEINHQQYVYLRRRSIDMEEKYTNIIMPSNLWLKTNNARYVINDGNHPYHIWIRPSIGKYLHIHQCKDEYFIVRIDYASAPAKYYKCDQIEGVLQLLKYQRIK